MKVIPNTTSLTAIVLHNVDCEVVHVHHTPIIGWDIYSYGKRRSGRDRADQWPITVHAQGCESITLVVHPDGSVVEYSDSQSYHDSVKSALKAISTQWKIKIGEKAGAYHASR